MLISRAIGDVAGDSSAIGRQRPRVGGKGRSGDLGAITCHRESSYMIINEPAEDMENWDAIMVMVIQ
jgi:hypothetical protein